MIFTVWLYVSLKTIISTIPQFYWRYFDNICIPLKVLNLIEIRKPFKGEKNKTTIKVGNNEFDN